MQFGAYLKIEIYAVDVQNEVAIQQTIENIGNQHGGIDLLINNAGIASQVRFDTICYKDLKNMMNINYYGAVYTTKSAWRFLHQSKGHVAFVSSVAGYTGVYGYTYYTPTKFALTGLVETLRMEAKDFGIGVTIIYPPDTDTPMLHKEHENAIPETLALAAGAHILDADFVAQKLIKGIQANQFEVYCNFQSKLIRWLRGISPQLYFYMLDQIIVTDRKKRGVLLYPV
jgi:3-dehydrosphinganine reductase